MPAELEELREHLTFLRAERDAAKQQEKMDGWMPRGGVSIVIMAVFAGLSGQSAAKYSGVSMALLNDATYFEARASDQWGYYQAKSTRQSLYLVAREQEAARPSERSSALLAELDTKATKFGDEKAVLQVEAEKLEQQGQQARAAAAAWIVLLSRMGLAITLYQVAIAVASIGMLIKVKRLWYGSLLIVVAALSLTLRTWLS